MQHRNTPIDLLSKELLLHIFAFLNHPGLKKVEQTCTKWRKILITKNQEEINYLLMLQERCQSLTEEQALRELAMSARIGDEILYKRNAPKNFEEFYKILNPSLHGGRKPAIFITNRAGNIIGIDVRVYFDIFLPGYNNFQFSHLNLGGIFFRDIFGMNFYGSNFTIDDYRQKRSATFLLQTLINSNFSQTVLDNMDFSNRYIQGTNFNSASLVNTKFQAAKLKPSNRLDSNVVFKGANLSGAITQFDESSLFCDNLAHYLIYFMFTFPVPIALMTLDLTCKLTGMAKCLPYERIGDFIVFNSLWMFLCGASGMGAFVTLSAAPRLLNTHDRQELSSEQDLERQIKQQQRLQNNQKHFFWQKLCKVDIHSNHIEKRNVKAANCCLV